MYRSSTYGSGRGGGEWGDWVSGTASQQRAALICLNLAPLRLTTLNHRLRCQAALTERSGASPRSRKAGERFRLAVRASLRLQGQKPTTVTHAANGVASGGLWSAGGPATARSPAGCSGSPPARPPGARTDAAQRAAASNGSSAGQVGVSLSSLLGPLARQAHTLVLPVLRPSRSLLSCCLVL